jgi:hypothetical protein
VHRESKAFFKASKLRRMVFNPKATNACCCHSRAAQRRVEAQSIIVFDATVILTGESELRLEAPSKLEWGASHGDFRRFFYKATVNSIGEAGSPDEKGTG